jgi:3-oxoadipate enol-lactonase
VIERTVEVDGHDGRVALAVAEAGQGGRPLLLVHGFTGAKEDFTEWLDPLADRGWHAVALDQRGHGASTKPAEESAYSFDAFATDLLGMVDALGWERCTALGHSMGGMVVQTALLDAPGRFDGLVLMDTSHRGLRVDPGVVEAGVILARTEGLAAVIAVQDAFAADPLETSAHQRVLRTREGYRAFGDRKMLASSPAMYAAMLTAIADPHGDDRLDDLASVTVPTLVVVGEQDTPFLKPSRRMAAIIPDAELAVVPDGGHSPQFESPDHWWKALCTFLDRL